MTNRNTTDQAPRISSAYRAAVQLLALLLISPSVAATLTGKAEILDGDTIKMDGIPVRLNGIDAPEGRQTCDRNGKIYGCGKQATQALANLIAGRLVQCEVVGRDDYARLLGVCSVADTELNRTMVRNGWAFAFVKYSDRYAADQNAAETAKVGLWSGSFVKPWEWRLGQVKAALKARECAIKGNVNRDGERIYHLPFQQFYPRTTIDERKGERWFCTEKEALEAGWRRALR